MKKKIKLFIITGMVVFMVAICLTAVSCVKKQCNHSYEIEENLAVTCDSDGYTINKCSKCGDTYTKELDALGHDFVFVSKTEATCVQAGEEVFICNRANCGYSYSEINPATGIHSYEEDERVKATCTEWGSVHYVCQDCDDSYVELEKPLEHSYTADSRIEPNCTENGIINYVCVRCSDSYVEPLSALGHDNVLTTTLEPTCVLEGENTYECLRCDYTLIKGIPAIGHAYVLTKEKAPNCTKEGEYIYVCENFDSRTHTPCLHTETVEVSALGHSWIITDEVAPTYTSAGHYDSECSRCLQTKTDVIRKLEYELALNFYYGFTDNFVTTRVRSQDTEGYYLGKTNYYNSSSSIEPIEFDENLLLQNYYTHSILSIKQPQTTNDKQYTVDSGFKIQFGFNFLDKVIPSQYSEFLSLFDDEAILKVVQKKESGYFTVYEVVDLSWSSIQVAKRMDNGSYRILDEINTAEEWSAFLQGDLQLSDINNKPFFEKGTYRIMMKSNIAWFMEAPTNGAIYNSQGVRCYPYGLINDQYDYFYITVSGNTYNVLRPDELDETHDMFYQLQFDSAKTQQPFIKSGASVSIGDSFGLKIDTKLSKWEGVYHYGDCKLKHWSLSIALYDENTDSYIESYKIDLLARIADDGTVFISLPNDYNVQGNCKISVEFTLSDFKYDSDITFTDAYYLSVA